MKRIIKIAIALSLVLVGIMVCTPNARPFEMLMGIAPTGDVDFLNLPTVTPASVTTYSNGYDPQLFMDDSGNDITVVGANVFMLKKDRLDVVSTSGVFAYTVMISNNTRDYYGLESSGVFLYMTTRTADRMNMFLLTNQIGNPSNVFADQNFFGYGGKDFGSFQAKYMKINPADGSYWFIRFHQPIQSDNSYPESQKPPIEEQIRKYQYAFSVSNLSKLYDDNMRYLVGLRVPGGQCYGMAFHRGRLYVMYKTPVNDDGTVRFGNESSKTIFIIDPRTLTYLGKVGQKMGIYCNGLASDGVNLYTIGQTYVVNFSGYQGTYLIKMNIPN